jgi:hypothetical protein
MNVLVEQSSLAPLQIGDIPAVPVHLEELLLPVDPAHDRASSRFSCTAASMRRERQIRRRRKRVLVAQESARPPRELKLGLDGVHHGFIERCTDTCVEDVVFVVK